MRNALRTAVSRAVFRLMVPLVRIVVDAGIGVGDFEQIIKRAYVQALSDRQPKRGLRISDITVRTGMTRQEVARILKQGDSPPPAVDIGASRAERVLRGWWRDPEFLGDRGAPAVLPMRGSRRSFVALVQRYAGGSRPLPILRELLRANAARKRPDKKIEALSPTVATTAWEHAGVELMGERIRDLIETLSFNLQHPHRQRYARFVIKTNVDPRYVPLLLRDVSEHADVFADGFHHALTGPERNLQPGKTPQEAHRLGIGIFIIDEPMVIPPINAAVEKPPKRSRRLRTG